MRLHGAGAIAPEFMKNNLKPIAITQGDPAGIGPEIVAKAFRDAPDVLRGCFAVGNVATLRRAAGCIASPGIPSLPVAVIEGVADALDAPPRCVPVLPLAGLPDTVAVGGSVPRQGAPLLIVCGGQHAPRCAVRRLHWLRRLCTKRRCLPLV